MHLKNPLLFGLMAVLLLGGTITPAISQSSPDTIKINEVETNPTMGSQEYVELYNPTTQPIDISGWSLVPKATWKALEIPSNTVIEPKSFLFFTHVNFWFNDFGETISLYDDVGELIDETPLLIDRNNDSKSWQRIADGLDNNSDSDWELKRITAMSSNGVITVEDEEASLTLNAVIENSEPSLGDVLTISGSVSELLTKQASYIPEEISITIQGPNYYKSLELYPDVHLDFSTTLSLQQALGFKEGTYSVKVTYSDEIQNLSFYLNDHSEDSTAEESNEILELFTDKESYMPGEWVTLSASADSDISYAGLSYVVKNPDGEIDYQGTIFPNNYSSINASGFSFETQLFMKTVNPIYGEYTVEGKYLSTQIGQQFTGELTATHSFFLVEDIKEDVAISLSTDKEVYSVDDIIKVTGRSNAVWVEDLELAVTQTGILSTQSNADVRYHSPDPFTLQDRVRLNGDGTFDFEFKVIESMSQTDDLSNFYGDYRVTVGEYFGDASVLFRVVEDPNSYEEYRTPLGLKTDKTEYILNNVLTLTGHIMDYNFDKRNLMDTIEVTFADENGKKLSYLDLERGDIRLKCEDTNSCGQYIKPLIYKATPDQVGNFQIHTVLNPLQFEYGTYTITAHHPNSNTIESVEIIIKSAQSEILSPTETQEPITFEICKSTRAEVSEIIKDMKKIGKGEVPPSMESLTCDGTTDFVTGDKVVIKGKVVLKDPRSLDQSSVITSGQTQPGQSYTTNYAQAAMNYVQVSIPYPYTMTVSKSSAWVTIPDEGEEYHGGGGSGGGGVTVGDGSSGIGAGTGGSDSGRETSSNSFTGYDGTAVLKTITKRLTDMNFKAYPDSNGNFYGVFELRAGVFSDGLFAVKANYYGYQSEKLITVVDNSLKGGQKPVLVLELDRDEYVPGETVKIHGQIKNVYYYDSVNVKVDTPDVSHLNCLSMDCGFGNTGKKIRVSEGVDGAEFFYNFKIPSGENAFGKYNVIADTHFGEVETPFFVVKQSDVIGTVSPEDSESPALISKKIIEKFNRIPDKEIPITLGEKSSEDSTLGPRVLQGSLFTSARGEESDVNLRIITSGGQCVIGQTSDCLVTESTRKPGAIYSIVSIDDINYKIRYSGNDVRLEKFSIVPEESGSQIDIDNWNVEIMKNEQPSRFYYKVSYIALE